MTGDDWMPARRRSRSVRIGVNLLWLRPGQVGGTETYAVSHIRGLADQRPEGLEFTFFVLPSFAEAHPDLAARVEWVPAPVSGRSQGVRVAAEASWLAAQSRRRALDVVHHVGGTIPVVRGARAIVTVHDVQYLEHPEYFSPAKRAFLCRRVPAAIKGSELVLVPTEFTRREVIDRLGATPERVLVVPPGFEGVTQAISQRTHHDAEVPTFVYPALTHPHKDHGVAIGAMAVLRERGIDARLILTGSPGRADQGVRELIEELDLGDRVEVRGHIPRVELDAALDESVALVYPSRYEGFGAAAVEAMSRGVPVLVASGTGMAEVVAEAGMLLPPGDPREWATAMAALIADPAARRAMSEAGRARAADFGIEASTKRLIEVYRML